MTPDLDPAVLGSSALGSMASGSEGRTRSVSPEFQSQGDAESWVGEFWHQLVEAGVGQVTLFDGDREVYGPMDLRPVEDC